MPTSEPTEAFVWIWLPEANEPVVAGVLRAEGEYTFTYGQSYLGRGEAMPLYLPELPLRPGVIPPMVGDAPGCIRDACPDGWGQRVIENRLVGRGELPSDGLGLLDLPAGVGLGSDRRARLPEVADGIRSPLGGCAVPRRPGQRRRPCRRRPAFAGHPWTKPCCKGPRSAGHARRPC